MGAGREPQNLRDQGGYWTFIWGGLVALGTVLSVVAGPKILADQHELMCGWSPNWQRVAGWLGDCERFAKSAKVAVSSKSGALITAGPVPRAVLYRKQLQQFRIAWVDNDRQFIGQLVKSGFRLKDKDACESLDRIAVYNRDLDKASGGTMMDGLLAATEGDLRCTGGDNRLSGDAYALSAFLERTACWNKSRVDSFELVANSIDQWISLKGKSPDLKKVANSLLSNIRVAKEAGYAKYIEACIVKAGENKIRDYQPSTEAKERAMLLIQHLGNCSFVKMAHSIQYWDFNDFLSSDMERHGRSLSRAHVQKRCMDKITLNNYKVDWRPYEAALNRWAK